jgi:inner membrane protein
VMALAAVCIVRLVARKPVKWAGAFAAALIAVASHLLLDFTNIYGIRMLLPFSGEWLRLDITNVVDMWIWVACAIGVAAPFLARLVGGEIASSSRRPLNHGRGFAWFALVFILLYDCGRGVLHARAVTALSSRMYEEAAPLRAIAGPDAVNPFQWRGLVETQGSYFVQDVDLLARDPLAGRPAVFHKAEPDPAIEAARRDASFQEFLRFAQFPLWRASPYTELESGKKVEVLDMRFGTPAAPSFMIGGIVDGQGKVADVGFDMRPKLR